MAVTDQGERDLKWCLDRALMEYDAGSPQNAVASIMSDFTKCASTMQLNGTLVMMIVEPAAREGREQLVEAVMGFNV